MPKLSTNSSHKLSIAIDGNEANSAIRVGSNVYAFEILGQLEKLCQTQGHEVEVLLSTQPIPELPPVRPGWLYRVLKPSAFWSKLALPLHLYKNRQKLDVLYTPGHYGPSTSPIPFVSSIMDLAFLTYPQFFKNSDRIKLTRWTADAASKARKLITISHFSRQEVIRYYQRKASDIIIAPPAVGIKRRAPAKMQQAYFKKQKIAQPYFLYVGTLQPRKNIENMIEAFEHLDKLIASRSLPSAKLTKKRPQLVLAGKVGWLAADIQQAIDASPLKKRIKQLGFVDDRAKQFLYNHATASIQVGIYEGFGIPALESLQAGTPVVAANNSSLPEVVGPAGIMVDPFSIKEIAEGMWQAYSLTFRQRVEIGKKSRAQAKKFSWQDSAQKILAGIESATKS